MRKKVKQVLSMLLSLVMLCGLMPVMAMADTDSPGIPSSIGKIGITSDESELSEYPLLISGDSGNSAVNIITENVSDSVFNLDVEDDPLRRIAIKNVNAENEPLVFTNCLFKISGNTAYINGSGVGYTGETIAKIGIGENVVFNNCTFIADLSDADGGTLTTSGNDACIQFFNPNVVFNKCIVKAVNWKGQFLGLYGSANVTFKNTRVETTENVGGWSYAMYGKSVLNLENSEMTACGMLRKSGGGNINAFYSGDARTGYDAIYIKNSVVNFSDNQAGGFAINNVNIHVDNSEITVNDNAGNACNSGYWIVDGSTITMNGNRGGHALSCIGFEMEDSTLEILHNGYAGVYIQSTDSSLTDCTVDIRCNGEKLLGYTAGDTWLNGHTLTITDCKSNALEDSAWLGAVGRKGSIVTPEGSSVVAYDLNSNAIDNLKSNTTAIFDENTVLALNGEEDEHTLFLNPSMETAYARGNTENMAGNSNDDDLFDQFTDKEDAIGKDTAKIGVLTTAQLSHHKYDWSAGEVKYAADEDCYGAMAYPCVDVCEDYEDWTDEHPHSFDCDGTYVYSPLVGLAFDGNVSDDSITLTPVTNLPEDQLTIEYGTAGDAPTKTPIREGYIFTGWYKDSACTELFDFSAALTENYTVAYAGWKSAGSLHIAKALTGDDNDVSEGTSFKFSITLNDKDGTPVSGEYATVSGAERTNGTIVFDEMGKASVSLKGGEDIIIKGINAKTNFVVSEDTSAMPSGIEFEHAYINTVRLNRSSVSDAIAGGKESFVLFENKAKERASLIIVKHLTSDTEFEEAPAFEFKVTAMLNDEPVTGNFTAAVGGSTETITFDEDGVGTVYVTADSFKTITGFPIGTTFEVEEVLTNGDGYTLTDSKVITENNTTYADFSNKYVEPVDPGKIIIKKTVSDGVSANKDFSFTITLDNSEINGTYGDLEFTEGKADFTLKANERTTVTNIPAGTKYTVTENETAYKVTSTNATGTVGEDSITVTFNNATTSSSGGGGGGGGGSTGSITKPKDEPKPPVDTGSLNKADHFAYIVGRPDGYVYPNTEITRAEVATIFYRLLTEDARKELWTKTNSYPDVVLEDWYNVAISVMSKGGVVHGYPDGTFRPDSSITRAEFATIAAQFLNSEYVGENRFSDIDYHWAAQYINLAAEEGWISGYPDGTFKPDQNITRAEAMTLVNAVLERTPDKTKLLDSMIKWPDNSDTSAWYYAQVQEATNSHEYDRETTETPENWTTILPVRDWAQIERAWSDIYSSVNPGDVMD